ncbi:RelA/SpoT domain-containing protein [Nocardiopsis baichengensis]|uniref:RelA/SpoT domain-containing protein n=1 Tax=Nocardiopsis baichengensis TaxID=280240 RepID=UPI00036FD0AE|nr:RelA/SpoT domain-containing protein [Nocardiopsis baichengensis]
MPLPTTSTQLRQLGKRLAKGTEISDADFDLLARVLAAYQDALDLAEKRLRRLGYPVATRVKTTGTLVQKLRREPSMPLKSVQDVAGARIVVDDGWPGQDAVVERIVTEFADGSRKPAPRDRRAEPSCGYRAVHVVVYVADLPVEIQVRTELQDAWAQIVEKLGDRWGRGLRYGEGPERPDDPVEGVDPPLTRSELFDKLLRISERIHEVEDVGAQLAEVKARAIELGHECDGAVLRQCDALSERLHGHEDRLRATVEALTGWMTS